MKIRKMNATFGKLDRATLSLGDRLNIIQAPNEGGKSTWSAFLRAMLYGIPTNQRDKAGFLAEKNRYAPWSGAPMEGVMALEWNGREIYLRRTAKGGSPFGAFAAVDAHTGERIAELTADTAGPLLTGAEREVFERSAFMGQAALPVDGSPALEKRIAGLLSSGLEEVSFSQVERQLKDWQNRRKHNRTGLIPRLEEEIQAETERLARFSRARGQQEEGLRDLDLLKAEKARLEQEKAAHKALAEQKKWLQYKEAYDAYQAAKSDYQEAAQLFQNLPEKEKLLAAQGDLKALGTLTEEKKLAEGRLEQARSQEPPPAEPPRLSGGRIALCALSGVAAALLVFFVGSYFTTANPAALLQDLTLRPMDFGTLGILSLLAGVAVGGLMAFLFRSGGKNKAALAARTEYEARLEELTQQAQQAAAKQAEALADLLAFVHTFAPTATNEFGISAAISRALMGEDRLSPLQAALDGTRKTLELAKAALGPDPQPPQAVECQPQLSYQEVVARLAVLSEEVSRKERMVAAAQGELRTLGDPDQAEADLEEKKEELLRRKEEYEALGLAIEALTAANQERQARFSPALNQRAGELLRELTGGKYDALTLTKTFDASAQEAGEVLPRSILFLSQGTADQLYLAIRLAVCDLTLPTENPPFLVLDDALANFDDKRMELALEHLLRRSEKQQILLFTCQEREGAYLKGREGVTFTKL